MGLIPVGCHLVMFLAIVPQIGGGEPPAMTHWCFSGLWPSSTRCRWAKGGHLSPSPLRSWWSLLWLVCVLSVSIKTKDHFYNIKKLQTCMCRHFLSISSEKKLIFLPQCNVNASYNYYFWNEDSFSYCNLTFSSSGCSVMSYNYKLQHNNNNNND